MIGNRSAAIFEKELLVAILSPQFGVEAILDKSTLHSGYFWASPFAPL
jgi:hypothetical protein